MLANGHVTPSLGDFSVAFWVVTTISLSATIWNLRFAPEAGAEISGHVAQTALEKGRRTTI
jgi:hypothetical protein